MLTSLPLAQEALSGFQNATSYDQHRPSYPAVAVAKFLAHLNILGDKNAKVIEIASGTGKFTELLAAREEKFEIVAVEPHENMRGALVKKNLEGARVLEGDASNIPLEEGWGDALIAAQAFHWFATEDSLKEFHRVLRPGATFGMIWNVEDYNSPPSWPTATKWEQKLKDIINSTEDGQDRFRHLKWKQVFESQQHTTPLQTIKDTFSHALPKFSLPIGEESIRWTVWLTEEGIWLRFATLSQIANLDDIRKEEIHQKVSEALKGDDVKRNEQGLIGLSGVTHSAWTSRV